MLDRENYLAHLRGDAAAMVSALRLGPDAPVPACPGWSVAQLVVHTGRVHRMASAVVARGLSERPGSEVIGKPPTDPAALTAWFEDGVEGLIDALAACRPTDPAWNFTGSNQVMNFWVRRQAHETSIHRCDAQSALGSATPIATDLALDGVDELFDLLATQLARAKPTAATGGSVHLHATNGDGEWTVEITEGHVQVEKGHSKGDAAVRGTASELNLLVWGRRNPLTDPGFEMFGDPAVVERYVAVGAF